MNDVIFESYQTGRPINCSSINGFENYNSIIYVEQEVPVGNTQSNSATWLGISSILKKIFASSPAAKSSGFGESYFSFHSHDGQCTACKGNGSINVSLDFMNDASVICDSCKGKRFKPEVLEIRIADQNISEVLDMTFSEASVFFSEQLTASTWKQFEKIFLLAEKTGLSYLTLGQPLNTLSTGELQRLKLIHGLSSVKEKNTLLLLDEPSGGLHPTDILILLKLFDELISNGGSILCVTHDSLIGAYADHIIELGPEGGQKGGYIIRH
jgi:excinuclease ABC subunit A